MYYIYILSNWNNKVIYIGVTGDLLRRLYEHKNKQAEGFTKKYNVNKLIYFEEYNDVKDAIKREKHLKGWRREKKISLIEEKNPEWIDLSSQWEK